jgi:membrane associated rhomboid family serine protease
LRQVGVRSIGGPKIAKAARIMETIPHPAPVVDHGRRRLFTALIPPLLAVGLMWTVFAFDRVFDLDLFRFGVLPRSLRGLFGILVSPFVHGGLDHLMNNSAPILVLGWLLVYFYPMASWRVLVASWAISGLWVWVVARDSYHIGASGIVYGLAAFLFFSGIVRRQIALMTVSLIVVFLYGSMWWGVLPLVPGVSWESHLCGGVAGAVMAWFYRKVPPAHVPPPIVLEDGPDDADPLPGNGEGDEVDEAEQRWKRELAQRTPQGYDPARTSSTFPWE